MANTQDAPAFELPLPLVNTELPASSLALPLPLGQVPDSDSGGETQKVTVSALFSSHYLPSANVGKCWNMRDKATTVSHSVAVNFGVSLGVVKCWRVTTLPLPSLQKTHSLNYADANSVASCATVNVELLKQIQHATRVNYTPVVGLSRFARAPWAANVALKTCGKAISQPAEALTTCANVEYQPAKSLKTCDVINYQPAVKPACQWFDIVLPDEPEPFDPNPCGLPPPSLELPLPLRDEQFNALQLHLPLTCDYTPTTPLLGTYIVFNEITTTIDNEQVELFTASISTSRDAFCWQLSCEINHADYRRLNLGTRKDKPILSITINGYRWDFEVYPQSESQAFINNRASLTGRSQTAQLLGEAVMRDPKIIMDSLHARQIIDRQVEFLPFTLSSYDATDWLVPAGTYTQTGAPMDTIIDVAKAGGNFVESHRYEASFKIKKRWPAEAWHLANRNPTFTLPVNVVPTIDTSPRDAMQYNSVFILGSSNNAKGAPVRRELSIGTPEASSLTHPLYTDVAVLREAGIACLSDSGRHDISNVKTILNDKYNVRLAEPGEIAEIAGENGAIKGVVDSVNVTVGVENNAPVVWQNIVIDSYAGD
ncbi:MAG: hypothetical protein CR974_03895 [Gammaproteobacteria bacterium]|nr:MAG: hypothetical protein CR974_03895 [Gammaproteobacteria bacterium]